MDEDTYDDEEVYVDEDKNENPPDILTRLKARLKTEALSLARQLYCVCSVMIFPVLGTAYESMDTTITYPVNATGAVKFRVIIQLAEDSYVSSIIGLIIGGFFVFFIGRKYTVIAANLSHLACLSYSYLTGVKPPIPYWLSMLNFVMKDISIVAFSIYVAEIASPIFRAFFLGLYFSNAAFASRAYIAFKMLVKSEIDKFFRNFAILTAVSFVFALFTPETPFWLALKGNREKAEKTFKWLRAGKSDTYEFDLLLTRAENITEEHGIIKHLFSRTVVLATIFTLILSIGDLPTCNVVCAILDDVYYPSPGEKKHTAYTELLKPITSGAAHHQRDKILAPLIFLVVNFIFPRKMLYFGLYTCSVLIIGAVRLKLGTLDTVRIALSVCVILPISGITPLQMILPIEIYPIALREIGVVTGGIFKYAIKYTVSDHYAHGHPHFPLVWVYPEGTDVFYISLFVVPFMLIFMPETKNTNIYQLDELAIRLPMIKPKKKADDEDEYYDAEYEN